ncbi:MAG TPA: glycosyltransferase family 2 protein [Solirubrobacteraceae bacterium]
MRNISFVVPSHNRREALCQNLPALLELDDVLEVVVVIDQRSNDGTEEMIAREFGGDERVRLLRQAGDGLSSARNAGCRVAHGEWIVVSDDDLRYPRDYGPTLKRVASREKADIVGAPWLHVDGKDMESAFAEAQRRRGGIPEIDDHSVIPERELETPFMPAPALINHQVFERIQFDENYGNTGWRDETDFFVQATRSGFRCILTPATAMYQLEQWEGGSRRPRLEYEWSAIKNNWRFLSRHGEWLTEQSHIKSPTRAQLRFVAKRMRLTLVGFMGARLKRLHRLTR